MTIYRYVTTRATLILAATILLLPLPAAGHLTVRNQDGVAYVSGGVGTEEMQALKAMSAHFNLKVTMATNSGHFVSDVEVRIEDSHGQTVLDTVADGPLLFAQLKPGTYTVICRRDGKPVTRLARVTDTKQHALTFTWPWD